MKYELTVVDHSDHNIFHSEVVDANHLAERVEDLLERTLDKDDALYDMEIMVSYG